MNINRLQATMFSSIQTVASRRSLRFVAASDVDGFAGFGFDRVVLRACGECGAASTVVSYRGSFAGECGAASRVVSDAVSGLWHRGSFAGEGK